MDLMTADLVQMLADEFALANEAAAEVAPPPDGPRPRMRCTRS